MKHLYYIIFLFLFSCNLFDDEIVENKIPSLEGEYSGTFEYNGQIVDIRFIISDSTFIGISDSTNFPAIGKGSFSQSKDEIVFTNESVWSKYVDKSIFLDSSYYYEIENEQLSFWKSNFNYLQKFVLNKENNIEIDEKELIKEKLIGKWDLYISDLQSLPYPAYPPTDCLFNINDSIYFQEPQDTVNVMYYNIMDNDSIFVIHSYWPNNIEIKDTTKHNLIFYNADSIRVEQFFKTIHFTIADIVISR